MSKFSHFAVKKLYFKRSFNNISGNRGPLFSQVNFDQTYIFWGIFVRGFLARRVFGTWVYVPEPPKMCEIFVVIFLCLILTKVNFE